VKALIVSHSFTPSRDKKYNKPTPDLNNHHALYNLPQNKMTGHIERQTLRITADFSTQTLYARRSWKDMFQALKKTTVNLN
jgi:hypothetical protein